MTQTTIVLCTMAAVLLISLFVQPRPLNATEANSGSMGPLSPPSAVAMPGMAELFQAEKDLAVQHDLPAQF